MTTAVLDALERECARVHERLRALTLDDWRKPTRCAPLDVLQLAVHAWRGSQRTIEMMLAGPVEQEPEKDGETYFLYNAAEIAPDVVKRAQDSSVGKDPRFFAAEWRDGWADTIRRARAQLAQDDPVLKGLFGLIRLSEYLRTRVVEVTVHHMDIADALGEQPDPDPSALEATGDVLRGLLGTDLRVSGTDDVRFVLAGTGRAQLNDEDRARLGPLTQKFPLFS